MCTPDTYNCMNLLQLCIELKFNERLPVPVREQEALYVGMDLHRVLQCTHWAEGGIY